MANKKVAICFGLASLLLSTSAGAQNPTKYIKWSGQNDKFYTAYNAWNPGQPLYPNAAEDENFFISRVKYRDRFTNRATQAVSTITDDNEKKVLNWVPIGTTADGNPNALPSGIFDSDVFSMWNMITHYGNWTAPLIRMPGAFMDAANKNGVTTSVLASVPWYQQITATDGTHGQNFAALYNGGGQKLINLLKQYGMSGWGINSEFNASSSYMGRLTDFMADAWSVGVTQGQWPQYSMVWYTLVGNTGFSSADGLSDNNMHWFHKNGRPTSNYVFGNYNWTSNQLNRNRTLAEGVGRSSFDVYAGMNLQGGEGFRWNTLKQYPTSIGLWGAHDTNMFFNNRNEAGSSSEAQQRTYLARTERFFGNGTQNPAKQLPVRDVLGTGAEWLKNFHGLSAFVSAKSVLKWDLGTMPFYSFFNLGNGKFFNIEGKKQYNGEWYNISMQDYLPTWRYWFANSYLGTTVADNGLKATFTWDDAWFGGSSLQVSGTNAGTEYLHLFKTQFALQAGDKIEIIYKVVSGSADIDLAGSAQGSETTELKTALLKADKVDLGEWKKATINVGNGFTDFRLAGQTVAALALRFTNANNLVLRLGGFSIKRAAVETPAVPVIDNAKTQAYTYSYKGLDGKVIFNMTAPASFSSTDHVYNEDVKTAFFKIYMQQTGEEQKFITATTSWASLVFSAPYNVTGANTVRFGVSAVGLDGVTESAIAWSEPKTVGAQVISDVITIDKPVIKPNQSFTAGFDDPYHVDATWTITNQSGATVYTSTGKTFTTALAQQGIYNLTATWTDPATSTQKTETKAGYIQISATTVGAFPEITSLTFNGAEAGATVETKQNQVNVVTYTGKAADGTASRGVALEEKPFGALASSIDFGSEQLHSSWTLGFWLKFNTISGNTHLFNLRNPGRAWPANNWGHIRTIYYPSLNILEVFRRISLSQGAVELTQQYTVSFTPGAWYHLAYVFTGESDRSLKGNLYINGLPATPLKYRYNGRETSGLADFGLNVSDWENGNHFLIGGPVANGVGGINGVVDDVKYFKSALTADQVVREMNSGVPTDASTNPVGYWSFEGEPVDNAFANDYTGAGRTTGVLKLGQFVAGNGEGQNAFTPIVAGYDAGSPFVPGTAFQVRTTPTFTFDRATVANAQGGDQAGSASVTYAKVGSEYSGTLTLTNGWGSVSRTISVINVKIDESVEMTDALSLQAFPNPFVETVHVRFAEAGVYQLSVYDLAGHAVNSEVVDAAAGGVVSVGLNAAPGVYLLRVATAEGKLLQTLKLQKK